MWYGGGIKYYKNNKIFISFYINYPKNSQKDFLDFWSREHGNGHIMVMIVWTENDIHIL